MAVCDTEKIHKENSKTNLVYGSIRFDMYESGLFRRIVQAANSGEGGRWIFEQYGVPLPEENVDLYKKRLIKDRFPVDALNHLLQKSFGINFLDPDFYRPQNGCMLITEVE